MKFKVNNNAAYASTGGRPFDIKNDFEIGFRAARKPRLVSNQ